MGISRYSREMPRSGRRALLFAWIYYTAPSIRRSLENPRAAREVAEVVDQQRDSGHRQDERGDAEV
jgi:hypothetical protein